MFMFLLLCVFFNKLDTATEILDDTSQKREQYITILPEENLKEKHMNARFYLYNKS